MNKIDLKKYVAWSAFAAVMATGMFWGGTLSAQDSESSDIPEVVVGQVGGGQENGAMMQTAELTEEERLALLADIAWQLEEAEQELLRLSLILAKMALEEQVLALEQQLQEQLAVEAQEVSVENPPLAGAEELVQGSESDLKEESVSVVAFEQEEGPPVDGEEESEDERGFLAALGPLGNLGTPELSALGILVFLAAFILIRRVRARKERSGFVKSAPPAVPQVPSSQPSVQQPQSQQGTLQERREDLKDRVAWE